MRVLVANAGSSSLKLRLVAETGEVEAGLDLPAPGDPFDAAPLAAFLAQNEPGAVGHRIVHGGPELREPTLLDAAALELLAGLSDLAPLHNGPALRVLDALRELSPGLPHVACFDTAFHAGMPDAAALYALPRAWIERYGLRRYGFHGISHAWASRRAGELLGRPVGELRLITCHLGAGGSLAAVEAGRSIDTTMGFTPNEGLVMATRSGSVDPGLLLWLIREAGIAPDELEHALEHRAGLLGLSGTTGDMQELLPAAHHDERARVAIDVYVHRVRAGLAAMAASLGAVDALVFTGGIGEHAPAVRAAVCGGLEFLGVGLDGARNQRRVRDEDVALPTSRVRVLVIESREELEIARDVRSVLGAGA